jgi:hypothetical protein
MYCNCGWHGGVRPMRLQTRMRLHPQIQTNADFRIRNYGGVSVINEILYLDMQ